MLYKILIILPFLVLLVAVRVFENNLFYDPLLDFFHNINYRRMPFPEIDHLKLMLSAVARYGLNSIIGIVIIYLFFRDRKITLFSTGIFLGLGVIILSAYYFTVHTQFSFGYMPGFYIRRMVLQPMIFIVLFPALILLKYIKEKPKP